MRYVLLLVIVLFPIFAQAASVYGGNVFVAPTRLLFEGRDRTQEVTLVNRGDTATTYRIAFKNLHMQEDGAYEEITEPKAGEQFADTMLRFAPRQITLAPGASQTVRVMVRKPEGLIAGEYRSHLAFTAIPPKDFGQDVEAASDGGQVNIRLLPVYAVSIPVIVRHGDLTASASIEDVHLSDNNNILTATLHRKGNRSFYGDITVLQQGEEIGTLRGISLLTPYATRHIGIPLHKQPMHAPVTVTYRSREGDNTLIAQASMN